MMLYFDGVKVAKDYMTGVISSDELIQHFDESWIPHYQRERVMNKKKITSLKNVFLGGGKIDSVKLNLIGEYVKEGRQAVISGKIRVIDGQQRLWALKEANAKGINVPVELYLNISEAEEIHLFHQFNRDPSKLTFGELAKSAHGSFAKVLERVLKDKSYPVRVTVNSRVGGINLAQYAALLHMVHRKIFLKTHLAKPSSGKHLLRFLDDSYHSSEVAMTEFSVRNILRTMVGLFGGYDAKSLAYSRGFLLNFANVIVSYFLQDNGQISFGRYKDKANSVPKLLSNAKVRELIGINSHEAVFDAVVHHFNYKTKLTRLPDLKTRGSERSEEFTKIIATKSAKTVREQKQKEKEFQTKAAE